MLLLCIPMIVEHDVQSQSFYFRMEDDRMPQEVAFIV